MIQLFYYTIFIHIAFFAIISLVFGVVPDGSVILYLPSCSGKTRLGCFGCSAGVADDVVKLIIVGFADISLFIFIRAEKK